LIDTGGGQSMKKGEPEPWIAVPAQNVHNLDAYPATNISNRLVLAPIIGSRDGGRYGDAKAFPAIL
jgi:hypothetical protein